MWTILWFKNMSWIWQKLFLGPFSRTNLRKFLGRYWWMRPIVLMSSNWWTWSYLIYLVFYCRLQARLQHNEAGKHSHYYFNPSSMSAKKVSIHSLNVTFPCFFLLQVKTDWRSNLTSASMSDLLMVQRSLPEKKHDPSIAIELWHTDTICSRRPNFRAGDKTEEHRSERQLSEEDWTCYHRIKNILLLLLWTYYWYLFLLIGNSYITVWIIFSKKLPNKFIFLALRGEYHWIYQFKCVTL